jgi:hypothetical protein
MTIYKLVNDYLTGQPRAVFCTDGNKAIPFDPANTDYQQYLAWLAEGNTPLPADE